MNEPSAVQEVLLDLFDRIRELVVEITDGLTDQVAVYRPDPEANTVAWLLWHLARVQDAQVADAAGVAQVWTDQGWADRFGLPFEDAATGYGQSSQEVGQVVAEPALLAGYQEAVHAMCRNFSAGVTGSELHRVVDTRWDPPVTVAVRLVSILSDCLQHAGQAAYLRGLAERG